MLNTAWRRDLSLKVLEQVRRRYGFVVLGYVVMPEHIHLLIGEPESGHPSTVMQAIKQGWARRMRTRPGSDSRQEELWSETIHHFWQRRFYDFVVWTPGKRQQKLNYMHENPVKRGLVLEPEQWRWSSFRYYAYGEAGTVLIDEQRPAKLRKTTPRRCAPTQRKPRWVGQPVLW